MSSAFIGNIRMKAGQSLKHIVLPEASDERMLQATQIIRRENIAKITLLGNEQVIRKKIKDLNLNINDVPIIDPTKSEHLDDYAKEYYELRKHKGMTTEDACEKMGQELFYGAMMVRKGLVDGGVAGAINSTGDVMSAAFHLIGKAKGTSIVSSFFAMIIPEYMGEKDVNLFFGDCAVIPNPNASELADIAIATADSRKALVGDTPKIAMLSYSTKGSAHGEMVDKVIEATRLVQVRRPDLEVDGELQLDAAIVPKVAKSKAPNSAIAGRANVIIFPDLNAGNIGYKLVQRLANAIAFGPLSQGLAKPYNDLSRGCNADDIVNVVAACAVKAAS
ncbi:MAG: phosphate acetyltransferase [Oligoflexia bacterium]|nr:phosphate acetyltransferase [Oligoflexia bacterium]